VQATGARADELRARAPLDNGDVDARQHQPRRTAPPAITIAMATT
jgi:hypothetical protein